MTLNEQYKKETNLEVYILDPFTGDFDNTNYVEWLEAKINYTRCCTELKAIEDLKDFAYNNCQLHNTDQLDEIIERL